MKEVYQLITNFILSIISIGIFFIGQIHFPLKLPKQILNKQITPSPFVQKKIIPQDTQDWGIAKKIGEHTYTIKVGEDGRMATPDEVMQALNTYRQVNGRGVLTWDNTLATYAQERASLFAKNGTTDAHAGFSDFLDNQDGFTKLGFQRLGENSYYGGNLFGVHLIEWVFAKSPEHNANQLDSGWTHVGVGVSGYGVNLDFGGGKL